MYAGSLGSALRGVKRGGSGRCARSTGADGPVRHTFSNHSEHEQATTPGISSPDTLEPASNGSFMLEVAGIAAIRGGWPAFPTDFGHACST
jgi:hypothetical protein